MRQAVPYGPWRIVYQHPALKLRFIVHTILRQTEGELFGLQFMLGPQ